VIPAPRTYFTSTQCCNNQRCNNQWSDPVASVCDVCGKGPGFGKNVSFSHRRTPRRWNPNIQPRRVTVNGTPRRLNVCTSCIKAGKVSR
jgi:large subunit ribosomal protein L28